MRILSNNTNLEFGAQLNVANFFAGRVDDIRLYNRALSAAEIKAIYGRAITRDSNPN